MQTKYKLPDDVYYSVIWFIRGQSRRENEYKQKKDDILNGGGAKYITYKIKHIDKNTGELTEEEARAFLPSSHSNQSATEIKALALEALENSEETIKMRSVQQILSTIGTDIADDRLRENLQKSIILNINDRHEFPYDRLYLPEISKKKFYQYKSNFIYSVALKNNFLK